MILGVFHSVDRIRHDAFRLLGQGVTLLLSARPGQFHHLTIRRLSGASRYALGLRVAGSLRQIELDLSSQVMFENGREVPVRYYPAILDGLSSALSSDASLF
ncbi:hypothetical protein EBZ35_01365 [bacterium]|nr:hypothetical protein [bacterium]